MLSAMASRSSSPENDVFGLEIIPEREQKTAGVTTTDLNGLLQSPLKLHEDLKDGCGGISWPAGETLARYMVSYHNDLRQKTVVEIGAGGGLVGLAVANGCQMDTSRKLLITDQLPMLALMQRNIALNDLSDKVEASIFDWGSPTPKEVIKLVASSVGAPASVHPDVILAADCVYFEPAFPLLLQTLIDLIGPNSVCYFCFKKRRKADMKFIRNMMKTFRVEQIEYEGRELDRRDSVFLYSLTKR